MLVRRETCEFHQQNCNRILDTVWMAVKQTSRKLMWPVPSLSNRLKTSSVLCVRGRSSASRNWLSVTMPLQPQLNHHNLAGGSNFNPKQEGGQLQFMRCQVPNLQQCKSSSLYWKCDVSHSCSNQKQQGVRHTYTKSTVYTEVIHLGSSNVREW